MLLSEHTRLIVVFIIVAAVITTDGTDKAQKESVAKQIRYIAVNKFPVITPATFYYWIPFPTTTEKPEDDRRFFIFFLYLWRLFVANASSRSQQTGTTVGVTSEVTATPITTAATNPSITIESTTILPTTATITTTTTTTTTTTAEPDYSDWISVPTTSCLYKQFNGYTYEAGLAYCSDTWKAQLAYSGPRRGFMSDIRDEFMRVGSAYNDIYIQLDNRDGTWRWGEDTTGDAQSDDIWTTGEPSANANYCAHLTEGARAITQSCAQEENILCEKCT